MNVADELQKLEQLYQAGSITNDEFVLAKARILNAPPEARPAAAGPPEEMRPSPVNREQQTRQWAMFLHLSMLANFVLPPAGLVAPIVIWQLKKDELPGIDAHGKNAVNWIISAVIYGLVSALLVLVLIGIPMLIALGVLTIIFPIIAGIKANNGEVWKYPLTIPFVK
jgi:uncharacterized Tic20 family protein